MIELRNIRVVYLACLIISMPACATYEYRYPSGESLIISRGITNDKFDEVTVTGPGRTLTVKGYTSEQIKALEEIKSILKLLVEGAAKGVKP